MTDQADALLIGLGGSDRRYFRVRNGGKTAVLMECRPDDADFERHLVYTRFFSAHQCRCPTFSPWMTCTRARCSRTWAIRACTPT